MEVSWQPLPGACDVRVLAMVVVLGPQQALVTVCRTLRAREK